MTLREQNKLIEDMIRENPETTIKDFLEAKSDINLIRQTTDEIELEQENEFNRKARERYVQLNKLKAS